ncbi:hypothetical protein DPEC_G00274030 [Dallia pectoralis]|uniref:Uncharacterized protein n=1 Tax=Dallia pectoralis TaxID=75939 RepID=A0ACC2FQF6_DALPE|nr:hypothetical protein DPEC_G00274030 [Dallia pectoralis]
METRQETVASRTLAQKQRAGGHWISSRWNAIDPVALNERSLRDCSVYLLCHCSAAASFLLRGHSPGD